MSQNEHLNNMLCFLKDERTTTRESLCDLQAHAMYNPNALPDWDMLSNCLKACPDNDKMSVTFVNTDRVEDNMAKIVEADSEAKQKYSSFLSECSPSDEITVTLRIDKGCENDPISIYCFDQFCKDLLSQSIPDMLEAFSSVYQKKKRICFHILDQDVSFFTETMAFTPNPQTVQWGLVNRTQRLLQCEGVSDFKSRTQYPFIPEDFRIQSGQAPDDLKKRFDRICAILSLAYLAESSIIEKRIENRVNKHSLKLWFDQKEIVSCDYELDLLPVNSEFYEIYHQVYAEGNAADKAPLARTAIRTYLPDTGLEKLDPRVLKMFRQHYQLYLRENVEKYIELTNAMADFIKDSIQGVTDCISQLFGNLKTNLMAVLSFIFTVALANAVSDQPLDNFFTHDIKWILYIVFIGSIVYYAISIAEVNYAVKQMERQYKELTDHYKDILSDAEISKITKDGAMLNSAREELERGKKIWSWVWIGLIVGAFLVIDFIGEDPHLLKAIITFLGKLCKAAFPGTP